jgi:hypothetical protein
MIKVIVEFENKEKEAEDTKVSARFKKFEDILPWLSKIESLHEKDKIKNTCGFLLKKECKGDD